MRTLDEIVAAARLNEPLDPVEARYAIMSLDGLVAQLKLDPNGERLKDLPAGWPVWYAVKPTDAPKQGAGDGDTDK